MLDKDNLNASVNIQFITFIICTLFPDNIIKLQSELRESDKKLYDLQVSYNDLDTARQKLHEEDVAKLEQKIDRLKGICHKSIYIEIYSKDQLRGKRFCLRKLERTEPKIYSWTAQV